MEGAVTSFLPAKGYGFVRGDDGRDYFLHQSDLSPEQATPIEGQRLAFEEVATPKGYRARRVKLLGEIGPVCYLAPDVVLHSRDSDIRGWETLKTSLWTVNGSSRNSPDDAKDLLLERIAMLGANAAVLVRYYKTTGSEAGRGRGTHHYTIHNFKAHPVFVGKASTSGTISRDALNSLDENAKALKSVLKARTDSATTAALIVGAMVMVFAVGIGIVMAGLATLIALGVGLLVATIAFFVMREDHDGWLQPPIS